MAHILLLTLGSRGDVQPFVALGAALTARGHSVTLSTGKGFESLIEAHGLTAAPLSFDPQAAMEQSEIKAAMESPRGWLKAFRASQEVMQRQLDETWSIAQAARPQVIVYHPKAILAPYAARALGAVALPAFLQPAYVATGGFPNPLLPLPDLGPFGNRLSGRAMVAAMRLAYRMLLRKWFARHPEETARPGLDVLAGYDPQGKPVPRLHAHSRHIVPKPPDWGPEEHVTGYWLLPEKSAWEPPADLVQFLEAGPPPVYIGFGSMPKRQGDNAVSAILAALARTKTRAILAKGWGALAEAAASEQIHIVDSLPHEWLLPRCRAVVHHGGAGTTHAGLRWGRPTLICPLFGDQPFWGRQVARLGAGPVPLPLKRLTEDRFAAALQELLSAQVRHKAQVLGERIAEERGAEAAADLIAPLCREPAAGRD